jgi:hypothetical protein
LYGLGVQGVEVLILLVHFFLPGVVPASQQGFLFAELMLPASALVAIMDPPPINSVIFLFYYYYFCGTTGV